MNRKVVKTADGSDTISVDELGVSYHSKHGAIQESIHVFIEAGLAFYKTQMPDKQPVRVFEMGLGTGLNALLTCQYAHKNSVNISYTAVEQYPVTKEEVSVLNYSSLLQDDTNILTNIHASEWENATGISDTFSFKKVYTSLQEYVPDEQYDIIYYDAFAPNAQPELWTTDIFSKLYSMMSDNAILATYCSKGDVRRAMVSVGFDVQKIPGPPGKREMLRATKSIKP